MKGLLVGGLAACSLAVGVQPASAVQHAYVCDFTLRGDVSPYNGERPGWLNTSEGRFNAYGLGGENCAGTGGTSRGLYYVGGTYSAFGFGGQVSSVFLGSSARLILPGRTYEPWVLIGVEGGAAYVELGSSDGRLQGQGTGAFVSACAHTVPSSDCLNDWHVAGSFTVTID